MLVLTRKKGQSIMVGDDIEISVVDVGGDAVRIGIRAPREVSIHRREVYEAIREENIRAARAAAQSAEGLDKIKFSNPAESSEKKQQDSSEKKKEDD